MKIISTKLHGVLDYCVGFLLVASVWLPGLPTGNGPLLFALLAGIAILVLALFTDYEAGLVHFVPVPLHLFFDILIGVFLAIIPWLTRLHGAYAWVYFLAGVLEIFWCCFPRPHRVKRLIAQPISAKQSGMYSILHTAAGQKVHPAKAGSLYA